MELPVLSDHFAEIATALSTIAAVLVSYRVAARKIEAVRVMVNDQLTREKERALVAMRAQKLLLDQLLGSDASVEDRVTLEHLSQEIESLAEEIRRRDRTAAALHRGG